MARLSAAALLIQAATSTYMLPQPGGNVGFVDLQDIHEPVGVFPGATVATSNAAWVDGKQPEVLQYWPQSGYGTPDRVLLRCPAKKVVRDHQRGWPGFCKNLKRNVDAPTMSQCQNFCMSAPRCSVWQFVNQTNPPQCWVGFGTDCLTPARSADGVSVQGAQRIQHGEVAVLMPIDGWKINNLANIFLTGGDALLNQQRCQTWCYANIACGFWQFNAELGGCFVEAPLFSTNMGANPQQVVQYPLTSDGGATRDDRWKIGEYITHYCPPPPPAPTTPAPAPSPRPFVPLPPFVGGGEQKESNGGSAFNWNWVFGGVAVLVGLAAVIWYFMTQQGKAAARAPPRSQSPLGLDSDYESASYKQQDYEPQSFDQEERPLMLNTPKLPPNEGTNGRESMQDDYDVSASTGRGGSQQGSRSQSSYGQSQGGYGAGQGHGQNQGYGPGQGYLGQSSPTYHGQGQGSSNHGHGQGAGQYGQGQGYGGQNRGYGQGGSALMPPPTQLVDFGHQPGGPAPGMGRQPGALAPTQLFQPGGAGSLAPTQLLNQGMPYGGQYGQQRMQGLM